MDGEKGTVKLTGKAILYLVVIALSLYLIWQYYGTLSDAAEGFVKEVKKANAKAEPEAEPEKAQGEKSND